MTHREAARRAMELLKWPAEKIATIERRADERFREAYGEAILRTRIYSQIKLKPGITEREYVYALSLKYAILNSAGQKYIKAELARNEAVIAKMMESN